MTGTSVDLSSIRNYLYTQAELRWWWSFCISLATQLLSLIAVLVNQVAFLVVIGFFALIAPIVVNWLREWANTFMQKGDKCRRIILYADGLGQAISQHDEAIVRGWTTGDRVTPISFNSPYYSSSLPAGPARLADITAESAYFTQVLAGKTANYLLGVLIFSFVMLAAVIYFAIATITQTHDSTTAAEATQVTQIITLLKSAAAVATAISVLFFGDILLLYKKYLDTKSSARDTFNICSNLGSQRNLSINEAMQVAEDYHLVLIQNPPIPNILYSKYSMSLTKAYQLSKAKP